MGWHMHTSLDTPRVRPAPLWPLGDVGHHLADACAVRDVRVSRDRVKSGVTRSVRPRSLWRGFATRILEEGSGVGFSPMLF